jgi:peroxiredoxin family protein
MTEQTSSATSVAERFAERRALTRMAIVVRDDAYDRLYTPLTFAYVAATKGVEVDILFVLWAVRLLTEQGAQDVTIGPQHASHAEWFKEQIRLEGGPLSIHEYLTLLKHTGNVRLYGCRLAAATFDVHEAQLIGAADGIVDALWFLEEKAMRADHCQYF